MKKLIKNVGMFSLCMAIMLAVTNCDEPSGTDSVQKYTVDLSKMPTANEGNSATFDRTTNTFTVKQKNAGIGLWLENMDISDYNIIRIKYQALNDVGFLFSANYSDVQLEWPDYAVYCPSYLTEIVFPIPSYEKHLESIYMWGAYNTDYEQFIINGVTLEKIDNPKQTNVHASDESPVVDAATTGTLDSSLDAWDFVPQLGVGFNYWPFMGCSIDIDTGLDFYMHGSYSKSATPQVFQMVKAKGFKTIRLQVNPGNHFIDDEYTIDPRFLKDLKRVVDMAIGMNMNVIICGFFWPVEQYGWEVTRTINPVRYEGITVTEEDKDRSEALLEAFWKQISDAFNNSYDERLIFETMNEPGNGGQEVLPIHSEICNGYNQLIVDTIRETGGNNANRFIMIAAFGWPYFDDDEFDFQLPTDTAEGKLIPITHLYPMGVEGYIENEYTDDVEEFITYHFTGMDEYFFENGIPVYVSEASAPRPVPLDQKIEMMTDFMEEVTNPERSCAIALWEDSSLNSFCYYNRKTFVWEQEEFIDTLFEGQSNQ